MRPIVTFYIEEKQVQFELYPEYAPNAINGLIEAIQTKHLDNFNIERVVPGFVFQPWCDETKLPEFYQYVTDKEFETKNHTFEKYSVGLAGDGQKISVPSCFFITLDDAFHLNQKFCKVGKVISGFEYLHEVENSELIDLSDQMGVKFMTPKNPIKFHDTTIELNGYEPKQCIKYIE